MALLVLVNLYVFSGGAETVLRLRELPKAVVGSRGGEEALPALAEPPAEACSGDPVRIFEGQGDLVHEVSSLGQGRTARAALVELGIDPEQATAIEAALSAHVDLGIFAGQGAPLRVALDRYDVVHALEIELAEGRLLQLCRDGQRFEVRHLQHPARTDVEAHVFELSRRTSLREAVEAGGETYELAEAIARVLRYEIDFVTESRAGDVIRVLVEKRWLGRSFHRYGSILSVEYRGAKGRFALHLYKPHNRAMGWFEADGQARERIAGASPFGPHEVPYDARGLLDPSLETVRGRLGAVYRRAIGTPVVALGDAVVRAIGESGQDGLAVELALDAGVVVRYLHLSRAVASLQVGRRVQAGQRLGFVGQSGKTPQSRLRLEVARRGDTTDEEVLIDPVAWLAKDRLRAPRPVPPIAEDELERFRADLVPRKRALERAR